MTPGIFLADTQRKFAIMPATTHSSNTTTSQPTRNFAQWLPPLTIMILLVIVAVGIFTLDRVKQNAIDEQGKILATIASTLAKRLDLIMSERYGDLAILAETVSALHENPKAIRHHIQRIQEEHTTYAWIGVTNATGDIIASTVPSTIGTNISNEPAFLAIQFQESAYLDEDAAPQKILGGNLALLFGNRILSIDQSDHETTFAGGVFSYIRLKYLIKEFEIETSALHGQFPDISSLEWQLVRQDGLVLVDSTLEKTRQPISRHLNCHLPNTCSFMILGTYKKSTNDGILLY